jgi:hypothetical protein
MEKDKCIECDSNLKRIKFPKGDKEVVGMKCLNQNCSLCYVLTEMCTYDIGRWVIKGKNRMERIINNRDVQVIYIYLFITVII